MLIDSTHRLNRALSGLGIPMQNIVARSNEIKYCNTGNKGIPDALRRIINEYKIFLTFFHLLSFKYTGNLR